VSRVRQVAGGGRAVEVPPERLSRWFDGFAERNGGVAGTVLSDRRVLVTAADGTTATVDLPFEPLGSRAEHAGLEIAPLVEYAVRPRRLGLVLVRKGAHSIGIAEGPRVVVSRTDRHHVQGRTAAGGWSQQRFARRRRRQGEQALAKAADDVLNVLGDQLPGLDAVVFGGDRRAVDQLRADQRLASVFAKAVDRFLDIGEPRRAVLDVAAERARALEIVVRDPR
jgi:hypothetical protein